MSSPGFIDGKIEGVHVIMGKSVIMIQNDPNLSPTHKEFIHSLDRVIEKVQVIDFADDVF
ncbi:hypothetical protein BGW36DRAFT_367153 [Talaromyces proteolyticus]|uniref:Uncharacterized protein n=1 Tax=Talaromyces proteolyticus TaxID=1131652 RepID=A0AAD4Q637_9EURO|nr:uncharacterized protein BGW36DRAFT_367153 [Talaromyces proteolyticus]KAH8705238.1 hypothetical protein BGW36DRAFT_367153 [Talaromyces proteolyticus]